MKSFHYFFSIVLLCFVIFINSTNVIGQSVFNVGSKIYSNNDANNYYIGHYAVAGSDGLDLHWYGGIRLGDRTGNVMQISNGFVGIGTTCPKYKLDVMETIRVQEVKVEVFEGCDFVFKKGYKLMNLNKLDKFLKENQHLPEVASEKEMIEKGVNMKELQMKLLQKIEELTLYTIEQNRKIETLQQKVIELEKK